MDTLHTPCLEANSRLPCQYIYCFMWNKMVQYCVRKTVALVPNLRPMVEPF